MQHSFDIDIAKEYGILEAILLNNLWFWIDKNRANNTNYYDGYYWTYNSTRAFNELFPYVSQRQIQNALKKLIDNEILQTGNYNKVAYDRTLWYAFTEKGKCIMQKCKMDYAEKGNGLCKNVKPIPNINSDEKPSKKTNIFKKPTLEEVKQYCIERQNKIDAENFIDYYEANGWKVGKNPMKDWKAAIRTWERRNTKQPVRQEVVPDWINKQYKDEPVEDNELNDFINGFDPEFEARRTALQERLREKYKKKEVK